MADTGTTIGRVSVKVMPDTSKFRSETQGELRKIQESLKELKVQLDIDSTSMQKLKKQLRDWANDISPLKIEVKPELVTGATTVINTRLRYVTRPREIKLIPKIDNKALATVGTALAALSGGRVIGEMFDELGNSLMRLDKAVPAISGVALAIAGLGSVGIASVSNLAALSVAIAQIIPVAFSAAGAFVGMGLGMTTAIIALRELPNVLPEITTAWVSMKDAIKENFWAQALTPMKELIDGLLPQFTAGMASTATAMGGFFGSLATSLNGVLDGSLDQMFADLTKSIGIASTGTGFWANIIKVLGETGASYLPQLAQWVVNISKTFSEWLTKMQDNGSLKNWIDQGIANLGALGESIKSIGSIFLSVGTAAQMGGGSTLQMFADTLAKVAAVAATPAFQTGLAQVFNAAHTAISNITSIAGPALMSLFGNLGNIIDGPLASAGAAIGMLGKALATALNNPAIGTGLSMMFDGIMRAVSALMPAIIALAPVFGILGQFIGQLAQQIAPMITALLVPLSAAFMQLMPPIMQLASVLGGVLMSVIQTIMPALQPIFDILAQILPQLVTQLAPVLTILGQLIGAVVVALAPLVGVVLQALMTILTPIIQIVSQILANLLPPLVDVLTRLTAALTPVINAIAMAVGWLVDFLAPAFVLVGGIIADVFLMAIDSIARIFQGVVDVVMGIWNFWAGVFTGDWERVWSGFKQFFSGIWNLIVGILEAVLSFMGGGLLKGAMKGIKGIWETGWTAVSSFFKGIWTFLKNFLKTSLDEFPRMMKAIGSEISGLWTKLWNGIKSFLGNVWAGIKGLFNAELTGMRTIANAAMNAVKTIFTTAWNAVKAIFTGAVKSVVSTAKSLGSSIKGAFSNAGSLLTEIGKKIIQGLINGIKNMFGNVKSTLSGLTQSIKDWKGPASLDKVLLTDAGRMIIDGFIKGLESKYDHVRRSLRGLTQDVAGTQFAIPGVQGDVSSRLSAAIDGSSAEGVVQKVLNYYAAAGNSLGSEEDLFLAAGRARMVGW